MLSISAALDHKLHGRRLSNFARFWRMIPSGGSTHNERNGKRSTRSPLGNHWYESTGEHWLCFPQ
jgi:hypothetical protein